METWGKKYEKPFNEFFIHVAPSEATHLVKMGKISPWVLYLAETSDLLWDRLSDEQADIIASVIDPKVWRAKFELKKDDCSFTREILREARI
jgi:hypothetical protein